MTPQTELWRLATVERRTGRSKTDIYKLIREGSFPAGRPYRDAPRIRFWLSDEVLAWMQGEVVATLPDDLQGLIG